MADGKLLALPFQAAATTTALATKFGADITVVGKYLDRVIIFTFLNVLYRSTNRSEANRDSFQNPLLFRTEIVLSIDDVYVGLFFQ